MTLVMAYLFGQIMAGPGITDNAQRQATEDRLLGILRVRRHDFFVEDPTIGIDRLDVYPSAGIPLATAMNNMPRRTSMTPERIEELRTLLRNGSRNEKLDAMEEAVLGRDLAASLVPDLAALMTSSEYVPCTEREHEFSGHASLAWTAASVIESIGVAPAVDVLRRLLEDHQLIVLPEACYDQGAYIGDYSSETIAPAGQAAKLVRLMGLDGFSLLDELAANALQDEELIADPARRTIVALVKLGTAIPPDDLRRLWLLLDHIQALPEVTTPTTHRGFALRDMARDSVRNLEKQGVAR